MTSKYFNNAEAVRNSAPPGVFLSQLGIKAGAPALPMQSGSAMLSTTGVLMPSLGIDELANQDRIIRNDPRESYYWTLPNKLTPQQCLQMLRAALAGDLFQQFNLTQLMLDTWPTFRMASHQLCEAAAYMRYAVHPCAEEGQKPTKSAVDKADLVSRAIRSMTPNPFNDEKGFSGMAYGLCDAMLNGLSMVELLWSLKTTPGKGREWLPVSSAWVHPRHYTFDTNGNIALYNDDGERISPNKTGERSGFKPDPNNFVCAQFISRAGSPLGAGFMRPLVWYWAARQFNNEWMLNTAKQYGSPFIDITYKPGTVSTGPGGELEKLNEMLKTAGAQRRLIHPEGTTAEIHQASSLGKENPQRVLEEKADEACLFLLLGQKGTTMAVSGQLGNDDSHENVKEERKLGLATWLARNPLRHFARAILRKNYGNDDECPEVAPDTTKPLKPAEVGQMMSSVSSSRVPVRADEFYKKIGFTKPDVGEEVIVGGELMVQEEAMTKEDKFNEQLEQQVKQGEASMALQEEAQGGNQPAQASERINAANPEGYNQYGGIGRFNIPLSRQKTTPEATKLKHNHQALSRAWQKSGMKTTFHEFVKQADPYNSKAVIDYDLNKNSASETPQLVKINVIQAIASATDEELADLEAKLLAAERAPHLNGEAKELELAVNRLTNRIKF